MSKMRDDDMTVAELKGAEGSALYLIPVVVVALLVAIGAGVWALL